MPMCQMVQRLENNNCYGTEFSLSVYFHLHFSKLLSFFLWVPSVASESHKSLNKKLSLACYLLVTYNTFGRLNQLIPIVMNTSNL